MRARRIENADPADANAFRARGKPKILDGADGRIDRCLRHRMAANLMAALALQITDHTEVLRCFQDALKLQPRVLFAPFPGVGSYGSFVGLEKCCVNGSTDALVADQDEARGLHKSDGWGAVRCAEQAAYQIVRQRLVQKSSAHIAPSGDRAVDSVALLHLECRTFRHYHALDHFGPIFVSSRKRASTPALNSMSRPKSQMMSESRLR
jgi:hypothetical protein